jgi:3-keto-5-aminohexanoate cleavage enzyme
MEKLIIEAAINELVSKQQNRHVPYGPDEVAATVKQCVDAGMSYLHFHAREQIFGEMIWNEPELYRQGILKMRALGVPAELPWYPTYLTLEPFYQKHVVALVEDPEIRLQIAAIDMGSGNINDYDPRTKNFTSVDQTKPWSHNFHRQFFQICRDLKLRPYLGVYEPGALRSIATYLEMGWLEPPLVMKFFFSDAGPYGFPPNPRCLQMFVRTLELVLPGVPKIWFTMCYGHSIWDLVRPTIELGGHVRVGLGQYHPWYWPDPTGEEPTNAEQVARVADIAHSLGRGLATPAEARAAFGLSAWSGAASGAVAACSQSVAGEAC